jgi:6-phosphogluconolactonase
MAAGRALIWLNAVAHRMTAQGSDGANGNLTKLDTYPAGKNPNWIEIVSLP